MVVGDEDSVAFGTCLHECNEEKVESKHTSAISLLIAWEEQPVTVTGKSRKGVRWGKEICRLLLFPVFHVL